MIHRRGDDKRKLGRLLAAPDGVEHGPAGVAFSAGRPVLPHHQGRVAVIAGAMTLATGYALAAGIVRRRRDPDRRPPVESEPYWWNVVECERLADAVWARARAELLADLRARVTRPRRLRPSTGTGT